MNYDVCTSPESQQRRKEQFNRAYMAFEDAASTNLAPYSRSAVWLSIACLESGRYEQANKILREVELIKCHFMPMQMLEILKNHREHIDPDNQERMTAYIRGSLEDAASEEIHIGMYNDNFSNMAVYVLIIAGEMFDLPHYLELGKQKLREVVELFSRSGAIMEFGSPTYTPVDTLCFAQLYNHAQDPWVRETALKCEERMWLEIATHYHPETSLIAGPHSRAYGADSIGHPGLMAGLLWKVWGDAVFINPIRDSFPPHPKQVIHIALDFLMHPNVAWLVSVEYHCPDFLTHLAFHKNYPYEVGYRTECLPSNLLAGTPDKSRGEYCDCAGGKGWTYSYLTEEYTLGTAERAYHSGALSNSFYLTYRHTPSASCLQDTGVIYCRYLFNDHLPDQTNTYTAYGTSDKSSFRDEGCKVGTQHKNVSIMLYHPLSIEREHVTSARLSLLIPCYFSEDIQLATLSGKISGFSYQSRSLEPIFLKAGQTYCAFFPMTTTDLGRDRAVQVEMQNHHILISFYNYSGEERAFSAEELEYAQAGFACVCGTEKEYPSMEDFQKYALQLEILEDRMENQERAVSRRMRCKFQDDEFRLIYSPCCSSTIVHTINRKPVDLTVFQADGLEHYQIPFLDDSIE